MSKLASRLHLWGGVLFSVVFLVVAVTGILLNHKRALGLVREAELADPPELPASLSLDDLAARAIAASGGAASGVGDIDRMDVRPRKGLVKVRFRDGAATEVVLALGDGSVLLLAQRGDAFIERLHSGEVLGPRWVFVTDAAAVVLVLLVLTGFWLWLKPRRPR